MVQIQLFLASLLFVFATSLPQTSPFPPSPPSNPTTDTKFSIRYVDLPSQDLKNHFWITTPVVGASIDVFTRVSTEINYRGRYADFETEVALSIFNKYCSSSDAMLSVDVGSHIGWFTMLSLSSGCSTIAVEGNPDFVSMLKTSYSMTSVINQNLPTLSIYNNLIGGHSFNGLSVSPDWQGSESGGRKELVKLVEITLDSVISAREILYLKLDVEGAELQALKSGIYSMKLVKFFMVEISLYIPNHSNVRKQKEEAIEALEMLSELEFTLYESYEAKQPGLQLLSRRGNKWREVVNNIVAECHRLSKRHCQIEVFGSGIGWQFPGTLLHENRVVSHVSKNNSEKESDIWVGDQIKTVIGSDGLKYLEISFAVEYNTGLGGESTKYFEVEIPKDIASIEKLHEEVCAPANLDVDYCLELIRQIEYKIYN